MSNQDSADQDYTSQLPDAPSQPAQQQPDDQSTTPSTGAIPTSQEGSVNSSTPGAIPPDQPPPGLEPSIAGPNETGIRMPGSQDTPPAEGDGKGTNILSYLQGQHAMPQDQLKQAEKQLDPQGSMNPTERNMKVIAMFQKQDTDGGMGQEPSIAGPNETGVQTPGSQSNKGAAAIEAYAQQYNTMAAGVQVALSKGNWQVAAQNATLAFSNVPDGNSVAVVAQKTGGFMVDVKQLGGKSSQFNLSPEQLNALVKAPGGAGSPFDNWMEQPAPSIIKAIAAGGGMPIQQPNGGKSSQQAPTGNIPGKQPGVSPADEAAAGIKDAVPGKPAPTYAGNVPSYQVGDAGTQTTRTGNTAGLRTASDTPDTRRMITNPIDPTSRTGAPTDQVPKGTPVNIGPDGKWRNPTAPRPPAGAPSTPGAVASTADIAKWGGNKGGPDQLAPPATPESRQAADRAQLEAIADARPGYRPQREGGGLRMPQAQAQPANGQTPRRGRMNKGTAQPAESDQPLLSQNEANNPGQGRNVQKGQQASTQTNQQTGEQAPQSPENLPEAPSAPEQRKVNVQYWSPKAGKVVQWDGKGWIAAQ
jgi:hypothetical protein